MRKIYLLLLLHAFILPGLAQQATIKGSTGHALADIYINRLTPNQYNSNFDNGSDYRTDKQGNFTITLPVTRPEIIYLGWRDTVQDKFLQYNLFLSPGDNITFTAIPGKSRQAIKVTGKGANNNQPFDYSRDDSLDVFYKDTLPDGAYNYLLRLHQLHRVQLKKYIDTYKPSPAFVSAWRNHFKYEMADAFYGFEKNNAFGIREAYARNIDQWLNKRDALFSMIELSNDSALNAPSYGSLLFWYVLRTKEELWNAAHLNRDAFLRDWYPEMDTATAWKTFTQDQQNDLKRRIIDKYFKGSTKEFLYALLIHNALDESSVNNLSAIYASFVQQYPSSVYLPLFRDEMAKFERKMERTISEKMHFVKNDTALKTFEEVLAQFKGQTVLLDMWGTWCGPCREEIERNSAAIKTHFKGKPVTFLYIANFDMNVPDKWKQLIAYFNLEGYHILANNELSSDIMARVKGTGYPTYVIIKKDGSYELSKAGYPMDREKLIAQMEAALK